MNNLSDFEPPDRDDKDREARPSRFDPWRSLTAITRARIALGRSGAAVRTSTHLEFQAAHAAARDAVHKRWDPAFFATSLDLPVLRVESAACDRATYLARPELGRSLEDTQYSKIETFAASHRDPAASWDVVLILTDGLSAEAIERHGHALLSALVGALSAASISIAPVVLVPFGRVAIADPIGEALRARVSIILVGERPGLSASDSLGLYLTFDPRRGRTDADRNCISNIRPPDGLDYLTAAQKATWLAREALSRGYSGVALKDESPEGLSLVRPLAAAT